MNQLRAFKSVLLVLALAATPAFAMEWTYSWGLHDYIVPDVDSHTFGINGTAQFTHTTASGTQYAGAFDLFLDNDKDDLDPDHIPIWWRLNFQSKRGLSEISSNLNLDFLFDFRTKVNTVSSVERQIKAMPGIVLAYDTGSFHASVTGLGGFYFLEIDDDVPDERGYTREDYRNPTGAFSLMADASFALGKSMRLGGSIQQWHDGDTWLENQYVASLRYDTDSWRAHSALILSVEFTEYNLDIYYPSSLGNPPTVPYLPILPWDDDIFVRFSFNSFW
jgi:hypothetical protein